MRKLDKIISIDTDSGYVVVQPGIAYNVLNEHLIKVGYYFYVLNTPSLLPHMNKLIHNIAIWSVYGLLFYQVIRSAFKSIALPLILIVAAGTGFLLLSQHWASTSWINPNWLQAAMLIDIVGIFTFSVDIE